MAENFPATPTQPGKTSPEAAKIQHQTSSISKVRVVLKLRPFLPREISSSNRSPKSCVSVHRSESQEISILLKDHETSRSERYKLDAVFGQEDDNVISIFEKELRPLIPGIFRGYNATVFAYGATGSGKTYTMQGTDELPGLIPLSMSNILSVLNCAGSRIGISYYEIYLDKCYDLLNSEENEILVWNDKQGQIHLKGLTQVQVNSTAQFHQIFSSALQRRKVARTGLNDVSSRSHGVLSVTISTPSHDSVVTGKLNLIDLAGNEDNRRTCNEGIRLQESAKINQSLFALSNVIYALNNAQPRIPYRESKLTRILQDSLGGTSRSLMVACLNPGEYQESVHTVSLAARSRYVSNFVGPNQSKPNSNVKVDMEAKLLAWLESKGKTKGSKRMDMCRSPFCGRTSSSVKPMRKLNASVQCNETKAVTGKGLEDSNQSSPCMAGRNLFHGGELQNLDATEMDKTKVAVPVNADAPESFSENGAILGESINGITLSPVNENTKALRSPIRKALSPIDSNSEKSQPVPSEPKTPKLHPISIDGVNNFQVYGTPLDKLNAQGSSIKTALVQDYIEFLNAAKREELMELKGIGERIAEYIIELRETSPLKSLGDLEKIGLSSKQVHNMFGKAASGLLEKLAHNGL